MERRHFLKFAAGFAASAVALAAAAQAAPLAPNPLGESGRLPAGDISPAVTTGAEVDRLKPQQVRWGHHWHRRHWGWHRRWHRRHWRRRYW